MIRRADRLGLLALEVFEDQFRVAHGSPGSENRMGNPGLFVDRDPDCCAAGRDGRLFGRVEKMPLNAVEVVLRLLSCPVERLTRVMLLVSDPADASEGNYGASKVGKRPTPDRDLLSCGRVLWKDRQAASILGAASSTQIGEHMVFPRDGSSR